MLQFLQVFIASLISFVANFAVKKFSSLVALKKKKALQDKKSPTVSVSNVLANFLILHENIWNVQ